MKMSEAWWISILLAVLCGAPRRAHGDEFHYVGFAQIKEQAMKVPAVLYAAARSVRGGDDREISDLIIALDQQKQIVESKLSRKKPLTLKGWYLVNGGGFFGCNGDCYFKAVSDFIPRRIDLYNALRRAANKAPSNAHVKEVANWARDTVWVGAENHGSYVYWYDAPIITESEYAALPLE